MPLSLSLKKECCRIERSPQPNLSNAWTIRRRWRARSSHPKKNFQRRGAKLPSPHPATENEAGSLAQDQTRRESTRPDLEKSAAALRRHRADTRCSCLNIPNLASAVLPKSRASLGYKARVSGSSAPKFRRGYRDKLSVNSVTRNGTPRTGFPWPLLRFQCQSGDNW